MSFGPRHTECHLLFSRHISCPYFWHVSTMDAACDQFPAWSCPLKRAVYSTPDSQCLECYIYRLSTLQCESKKSPLRFSEFFPKRLGIFNQFLHTYYVIISTDYRARQKSNPLGKMLYLKNFSRYIYQICRVYR